MDYNNITLQINLSPGDVTYAQQTVPRLVEAHQSIKNRLLVVDCCRPQKTKIFDPDQRIPVHVFEHRVNLLLELVEDLRVKCAFTEVAFLHPNDKQLFKQLSLKYLDGLYECTHSAGGTANMSYWAALYFPKTRYILHFDGDILIHQKEGNDWVQDAIAFMKKDDSVVAAVPRLSPPDKNKNGREYVSRHIKFQNSEYWIDDWFSTRHFLIDNQRFESFLPLVRGRIKMELLLRKWLKRAFPRDPEILLFKTIGGNGGRRLILKNENVFLLHPTQKNDVFLRLLGRIMASVDKGLIPKDQEGKEDLDLDAWVNFLEPN